MLESVKLDVPVILQNPELPNGCEVTSLAEVLQFYGFSVSIPNSLKITSLVGKLHIRMD